MARNSIFEFDRNLNVVQGEINALEREIELLRSRQLTTAEVTVNTAGRVVQVLKNVGDRVRENEPLLRMEQTVAEGGPEGFCGGNVHAILYVPTQLAAKVRSGDVARVSPSDVKREEYGYIVGRVEWVATYAASSDDMREKLKNDQLVTGVRRRRPGLRGARVPRQRRRQRSQRLQVVVGHGTGAGDRAGRPLLCLDGGRRAPAVHLRDSSLATGQRSLAFHD